MIYLNVFFCIYFRKSAFYLQPVKILLEPYAQAEIPVAVGTIKLRPERLVDKTPLIFSYNLAAAYVAHAFEL